MPAHKRNGEPNACLHARVQTEPVLRFGNAAAASSCHVQTFGPLDAHNDRCLLGRPLSQAALREQRPGPVLYGLMKPQPEEKRWQAWRCGPVKSDPNKPWVAVSTAME